MSLYFSLTILKLKKEALVVFREFLYRFCFDHAKSLLLGVSDKHEPEEASRLESEQIFNRSSNPKAKTPN